VDSAEGRATLKVMATHRILRPARGKLASGPALAAPGDEHAQLVAADQRFQAALDKAIASGSERVAAVQDTVQLKRHTKLSPSAMREDRLQSSLRPKRAAE
jgi:hypothetical protein